jgi:hypothetical protein
MPTTHDRQRHNFANDRNQSGVCGCNNLRDQQEEGVLGSSALGAISWSRPKSAVPPLCHSAHPSSKLKLGLTKVVARSA